MIKKLISSYYINLVVKIVFIEGKLKLSVIYSSYDRVRIFALVRV